MAAQPSDVSTTPLLPRDTSEEKHFSEHSKDSTSPGDHAPHRHAPAPGGGGGRCVRVPSTVTPLGSVTSWPRCPTVGGPVPQQVAEHAQLGTDRAVRGSHQAGAPCFGVGSDGAASDHTGLCVSSGKQLAAQGAATISKEAAQEPGRKPKQTGCNGARG